MCIGPWRRHQPLHTEAAEDRRTATEQPRGDLRVAVRLGDVIEHDEQVGPPLPTDERSRGQPVAHQQHGHQVGLGLGDREVGLESADVGQVELQEVGEERRIDRHHDCTECAVPPPSSLRRNQMFNAAMATLVSTIGTEPMSEPYTTKITEPTSEMSRRRTTEVMASDSTTNAEAR